MASSRDARALCVHAVVCGLVPQRREELGGGSRGCCGCDVGSCRREVLRATAHGPQLRHGACEERAVAAHTHTHTRSQVNVHVVAAQRKRGVAQVEQCVVSFKQM
jgi:hypothetical protein